ncbi:hypothetical protein MRB53_010982 [Persea americana]|uniref:Uncharacterized protein n=1 Tax=Persea americana TaxID=3435 RepID=A0ACC2LTI9_PERAE|nr:hypothetical protein MRB53_010982 [Persea americana]
MDGVNQEQADKDEEIENLESLNRVLIVKAQTSNNELQEARKELINGFQGLSSARSLIGIKRLGELNVKPFRNACQQRFSSGEVEIKSVELSSLWQNHINDPQWHPFKFANIDGKLLETIDDGDARVKELKDVWGDEVYKAVTTALLELNDCNPSGRYAVQELWNFKENRKASLKEGIRYILNQLKIHKRRK